MRRIGLGEVEFRARGDGGVKDGGELKIYEAKVAGGGAVGDVPDVGIVVPHLEILLQFGEERMGAFITDVLDPLSAITGDQTQLLRIRLEHLRDLVAPAVGKITQDAALVFKTLRRLMTTEGFVHPPIVSDSDESAAGIFHLLHGRICSDWEGIHEGRR